MSLAVRLGGTASTPDDEDGLDEFLSSHGFEFIEGDRDHRTPTQDDDRHSDDEDTGRLAPHDPTILHMNVSHNSVP